MRAYTCPVCGATKKLPRSVDIKMLARCYDCGVEMRAGWCVGRRESKKIARHRDNQKRSQDQEKRAARRYGMRRQPGSGARDGAKSDLRKPGRWRAELKETIKKSFSLKLETLQKIEREAAGAEDPLLEIEFQGVFPHKRYVVLPDHVYESMINRLEALDAD